MGKQSLTERLALHMLGSKYFIPDKIRPTSDSSRALKDDLSPPRSAHLSSSSDADISGGSRTKATKEKCIIRVYIQKLSAACLQLGEKIMSYGFLFNDLLGVSRLLLGLCLFHVCMFV